MFLNKVITNFRQYGFMGLAWRVVKKVFRLVGVSYDSYYYLACELDYKELAARWEANSLKDVRQLSLADYEHGDPAYFTEEKMEILSDRFQHDNYLAYGAFEGERLVYSAMISLEEMCFPTPEVSGTLDGHECLICDVYCDPDRRGKGYHNRMTVYLLMKGYEKGYRRAVTTEHRIIPE